MLVYRLIDPHIYLYIYIYIHALGVIYKVDELEECMQTKLRAVFWCCHQIHWVFGYHVLHCVYMCLYTWINGKLIYHGLFISIYLSILYCDLFISIYLSIYLSIYHDLFFLSILYCDLFISILVYSYLCIMMFFYLSNIVICSYLCVCFVGIFQFDTDFPWHLCIF